jgi:hypothetical protein
VIFDFFWILIILHIDLESLSKSKTCLLNTFSIFSAVSCENGFLGSQNFKGSLYKGQKFFFLKMGQYGYQKIRIFTLISKMYTFF